MKRLPFFAIILLFLASCQSNELTSEEIEYLVEHPNLTMSVYGYYPPYQFKDEGETEVGGLFVDYMKLVESKINYRFKRIAYAKWSKLYQDAVEGQLDVVVEIHETEKREKLFDFYGKLFDSQLVLVTRNEDAAKIQFNDLEQYNVVLPKDYYIVELIKKRFPDIELSFESSEESCMRALNNGKYDAYIGPGAAVYYIKQRQNFPNLSIGPDVPYNYVPGIAISKDNEILSSIIRKATRSIRKDELERLYDNWLLKKKLPFHQQFWFWVLMGILAMLAVGTIFTFNIRLKKKVKQSTKNLELALEKSRKSEQVKTNFIHNISHEIRTPMNAILGFSELLKSKSISDLKSKDFLSIIIDSGKSLTNIIDNLLEISIMETRAPQNSLEAIPLKKTIDETCGLFKARAERKKLEFNVSFDEFAPKYILIDKSRFSNVLRCLLDNAIKYTIKGKVELKVKTANNLLFLELSDTGIGIKEEDQKSIFTSFYQLKKRADIKIGGLGLGLAIVKEHVLMMGGEVNFTSTEDKGTTFFLELPYEEVPKQSQKPPTSTRVIEEYIGYKVLIAEDEDNNFDLAKMNLLNLERIDVKVLRAYNGKEAIDICNSQTIHLVIMDLRMPIMDGLEATKVIKLNHPHLPVVAYTAYGIEEDIQSAFDVGCDDVVTKPINNIDFQTRIRGLFN